MKYTFKKDDFIQTKKTDSMDIFSAGFQTDSFSLVKGFLKSEHDCSKTRSSDRTYFILNGEAKFKIQNDSFFVKTGDLINIPKEIEYSIKGKAEMLIINNPPFNPLKD